MIFNFIIVFICSLTGIILLIGGFLFKKYPPKKINPWYGYRTKRSMKNQERWVFAQRTASKNHIKYSLIPLFSSFLGFLIEEKYVGWSFAIVTVSILSWAFLTIYKTEIQLKQRFD
ncbi:MAG: SdpI family protein [Bacteroidota bacterium]